MTPDPAPASKKSSLMKLRWRGVPLPPMVLLSLQNIQDYQPLNPQTQQPSRFTNYD
jgi:hypothetical protein